jgi:hypothetical protein
VPAEIGLFQIGMMISRNWLQTEEEAQDIFEGAFLAALCVLRGVETAVDYYTAPPSQLQSRCVPLHENIISLAVQTRPRPKNNGKSVTQDKMMPQSVAHKKVKIWDWGSGTRVISRDVMSLCLWLCLPTCHTCSSQA